MTTWTWEQTLLYAFGASGALSLLWVFLNIKHLLYEVSELRRLMPNDWAESQRRSDMLFRIAQLEKSSLPERVEMLEKEVCQHGRGLIELTANEGKVGYAYWVTLADRNGWLKDEHHN